MTQSARHQNSPNGQPLTSDEDLAAVTIGPRVPLNSTIDLAPYDPAWASQFLLLAGRVRAALAERVLLLEHVGSTSVPGLSAKPVIDMVLAVAESADESAYVPLLEAQRFALRIREPHWFEHRLLRSSDVEANLHVFSLGCEEVTRMLLFRDWLRCPRRRAAPVRTGQTPSGLTHLETRAALRRREIRNRPPDPQPREPDAACEPAGDFIRRLPEPLTRLGRSSEQ